MEPQSNEKSNGYLRSKVKKIRTWRKINFDSLSCTFYQYMKMPNVAC